MGLEVWAPIKLKNRRFSGWNFECDDKKNCKAANFSSLDMVAFKFYVSLQEYLKRNVYLSLIFFLKPSFLEDDGGHHGAPYDALPTQSVMKQLGELSEACQDWTFCISFDKGATFQMSPEEMINYDTVLSNNYIKYWSWSFKYRIKH